MMSMVSPLTSEMWQNNHKNNIYTAATTNSTRVEGDQNKIKTSNLRPLIDVNSLSLLKSSLLKILPGEVSSSGS